MQNLTVSKVDGKNPVKSIGTLIPSPGTFHCNCRISIHRLRITTLGGVFILYIVTEIYLSNLSFNY